MAKQDIIGRIAKNVNLQVEHDAGDITSQTKRLIHGAVSALHVQNDARVV